MLFGRLSIVRFFLTLLFPLFISSEGKNQVIIPTRLDLGNVKGYDNPDFDFTIKNTLDREILFLPIHYQPDISIEFEKSRLVPGESGQVTIKYYSAEKGYFSKDIPVFFNASPEPLLLTISAHIKSFSPNAFTECPRIDKEKGEEQVLFNQNVVARNALTGEVLNGATLELMGKNGNMTFSTKGASIFRLDRLPPGRYYLAAHLGGFENKSEEVYFTRQTPTVTLYLLPKTSQEPIKKDEKKIPWVWKEILTGMGEWVEQQLNGAETSTKDSLGNGKSERGPQTEKSRGELADLTPNRELNPEKYLSNQVIFLIDVSGSMKNQDKLPLMKISMKNLVSALRKEDLVTIIVYNNKVNVLGESISGDRKDELMTIIDSLKAGGKSYGTEGVFKAYDMAKAHFIDGGNNQIILASDGIFNSFQFSEKELFRKARAETQNKVIFSAIGFGDDDKSLRFLKTLARNGQGNFIRIQNLNDAQSALLEEIKAQSEKKLFQ